MERWRTGRKCPKNLWRETDEFPAGQDIGRMDSEEDALLVVRAVNHFLELSNAPRGEE